MQSPEGSRDKRPGGSMGRKEKETMPEAATLLPPPPVETRVAPPLTDEEKAERRRAMAAVEELNAEIVARRGGQLLADSTLQIRESRVAHTDHLLGH